MRAAAVCMLTTFTYIDYVELQKAYGGAVDRRGQQNAALVDLTNQFEAQWSKFYDDFNRFVALMSRLDV
jgi:hypothetical protein